MTRTFVDRGGTFTDVVHLGSDGSLTVQKVPSDQAIVGRLARGPLVFGTTVATNALLEHTGVPTLLLVTEGFRDLVDIGDMSRPALFDPDEDWPDSLATRVLEVPGRLAADGRELTPLSVPALDLDGFDAVAIVLLHGGAHPRHERALAAALADRGVHVVCGHQVSPERGYLERIHTTLVDAAITPVLRAALARDEIDAEALAMRSDGSLTPAHSLRAPDAVLSGPAGGVLAVEAIARQAGFAHAVGLDMGGTSTDVCRIDVGALPRTLHTVQVGGARVRRSALEVETIAAGGGSILRSQATRLTVGPDSAGADPGPACYGRGGPPTLTDAALAAGLVDPEAFTPPLICSEGVLPAKAEAFLDIAREAMACAVERLATARGVSLTEHALVSYGGAAGQHAAFVAERLGIRTVLVHPCASVLCAFGQSLAPRAESAARDLWLPLETAWPDVERGWHELLEGLAPLGPPQRTLVCRYQGTDDSLEFPADGPEAARERFEALHRARYGFIRPLEVEVRQVRVRVQASASAPALLPSDPFSLGGNTRTGPEVLFSPTTAVAVPSGWVARMENGLLRLEHVETPPVAAETVRTPRGVALWSYRLQGAAEQGGAVLRRLARSVNIRERLDFSVAVFDDRGRLIANAPHIPVHLGAMGETVRDLLQHAPALPAGSAWLTNDPRTGGSHLPDLTVISPFEHGTTRFFVASRAHHVDVGGLTPGSMPPHSRRLEDEGQVFRRVCLQLADGELTDWTSLLSSTREPDTVEADLLSQLAANRQTALALMRHGAPETLAAWLAHLHEVAREEAVERLPALRVGSATTRFAGLTLTVRIRWEENRLWVDFTGTGGPHPGNLNAPGAVTRAAVLYALRVALGPGLVLSEGTLEPVELVIPGPSVLSPPPNAAVVGGNVETSQQLVDLLFRALGLRAASQGTMNNLTIGGADWAFYETIGGGGGATSSRPGPWGRQLHMTNTRATDPEVLEVRLPLRVRMLARRRGSGGAGRHAGGDGLVRELEAVAPCKASLLASRRDVGPPGMDGGQPGSPGVDHLWREGHWQRWDGSTVTLSAGDRVRVQTPGGGGWGRS